MSIINFRPDDGGVQTLKKENAASPANRELPALTASVRIQPIDDQPHTPPHPPLLPTYNGPERRKGERRQGKQRVILDTRDHRERRRQAHDLQAAEDSPKIGIDTYG